MTHVSCFAAVATSAEASWFPLAQIFWHQKSSDLCVYSSRVKVVQTSALLLLLNDLTDETNELLDIICRLIYSYAYRAILTHCMVSGFWY